MDSVRAVTARLGRSEARCRSATCPIRSWRGLSTWPGEIATYTHVSDQHSTYGTKVIPTTWREAVAVLDEIFGNPTDLPLGEHTVDTAGQTLATFAIFQLAGLQFSPRIRDIGRLQLYRLGPGSAWRGRYRTRAAARPTDPDPTDRRPLE